MEPKRQTCPHVNVLTKESSLSNATITSPAGLSHSFAKLYNSEMFTDIVLDVLPLDTRHSTTSALLGCITIQAHRAVLSVRSDPFRAMFDRRSRGVGGFQEAANQTVVLYENSPFAFSKMIEYIYCGRISVPPDTCLHLMELADKYDLPCLKRHCATWLENNLCMSTVCSVHETAVQLNEKNLEMRSLYYILHNAGQVLPLLGFLNLSHSSLLRILAHDELTAPELLIFQSIVRWGRENITRRPASRRLSPSATLADHDLDFKSSPVGDDIQTAQSTRNDACDMDSTPTKVMPEEDDAEKKKKKKRPLTDQANIGPPKRTTLAPLSSLPLLPTSRRNVDQETGGTKHMEVEGSSMMKSKLETTDLLSQSADMDKKVKVENESSVSDLADFLSELIGLIRFSFISIPNLRKRVASLGIVPHRIIAEALFLHTGYANSPSVAKPEAKPGEYSHLPPLQRPRRDALDPMKCKPNIQFVSPNVVSKMPGFASGYVMTIQPLIRGCYFWQIRIDRSALANPAIMIGVASVCGIDHSVPVYQQESAWLFYSRSGKTYHNGTCKPFASGSEYACNVTDTVGVRVECSKGLADVYFLVNEKCYGKAFSGLPTPLYPVIELFEALDQVTLINSRFTTPPHLELSSFAPPPSQQEAIATD